MLGLQETSGKVAFDLSTLRIGEPAPLWPITNQNLKCEYSVKSEKRLRGVMSPSQDMTVDDFDTLQSWGATLIRYQMGRNWNAQKVTPITFALPGALPAKAGFWYNLRQQKGEPKCQ